MMPILNSEKAESPVTPNISRTSTSAAVASVVSNAGNTPPSLDEKRMRREIANSNERRRMQSINAGFQSLRTLLPHHEGEKLSKAAILQQTAEYIYQLEQERTQLLQQNCHLKRIISQHEGELASNSPPSPGGVPSKKRKTTDSSDEEVVVPLIDDREGLRMQLDRERALRIHLEEKVARLESIYPIATAVTTTEKLHDNLSSADQITIQFKDEPKEETIILSSSKGGPGIPQSLENGRRIATEIQLQQSSANIVNVVTETKSQRVAATSATTSVILQPVTHEESLLPSAIINGHQYAVSPTAVVPVAGKPSKPKVEVERLPSPTSVSLTTTIAATRITNTSTNNSSTRLMSTNTSPSHQIEQMSPVSASADVFTIQSHSRQNLEAIVEAIRHLEGDSAFDSASTPSSCSSSNSNISINSDSSCNGSTTTPSTTTATGTTGRSPIAASAPNQEAPLALTKRTAPHTVLQVDMNHMNSFVRFNPRHHSSASGNGTVPANEQQQRPGVIVVKQQT